MFKVFTVAVLSIASALSHSAVAAESNPADEIRATLPAGLSCTTDDRVAYGQSKGPFEITRLNSPTKSVDWNNDGGSDGAMITWMTVSFNFNNGCDNNYDFVLMTADLVALAEGKLTEIRGMLHFANYYGDEADGAVERTALLTCTKL
jgi:hypothetical protein